MSMGLCPFCEKSIKDYKPVSGFCAPEYYATMREHHLDPITGHADNCQYKEIRL